MNELNGTNGLNGTHPIDSSELQACWLVDMGYVVGASERFKLDYIKTQALLSEQFGRIQTYLFNGYDPAYGIATGLRAFYDAMKAQGMALRLYAMASGVGPGDNRQRSVDVDIGAHLVWYASLPNVQQIVLTSGDRDLIPAVEIARQQFNKKVLLFTYQKSVSRDLVNNVTDWWRFDDFENRVARP